MLPVSMLAWNESIRRDEVVPMPAGIHPESKKLSSKVKLSKNAKAQMDDGIVPVSLLCCNDKVSRHGN